jgi:hypothetical protein
MTVDIDGNTAAVGASGFRFSDFPLPVVCVYTREAANWTKEQCLSEEDEVPNSDDNYGFAIAISGNTLVVGAASDVTNGVTGGAAYVYVRDGHTWSLQQNSSRAIGPISISSGSLWMSLETLSSWAHTVITTRAFRLAQSMFFAVTELCGRRNKN